MHARRIHLDGFLREDGLMEVEAHLVDTKPYSFDTMDRGTVTPGTPLHEMWVRITIDDALTIVAAEAATEHGPFNTCGDGAASFAGLVGLAIRPGFLKAANARMAGVHGCTHIREMLQQVATVALQSLWPARARREAAAARQGDAESDGATRLIDTCHAYAADGDVVQRRWPHRYTGPRPGETPTPQPASVAAD